jgi:cytoskeletal protein CcmA (bactofilin family)
MGKARWIGLGLLLLMGAITALVWFGREWLFPAPTIPGGVVIQQSYRLDADSDGDLIVFGETVTIPDGMTVRGNAWLIADRITIDGQIDGTLTAIADEVLLSETSRVGGEVALLSDVVTARGVIGGALRMTGDELTLDSAQIGGAISGCAELISAPTAVTCERASLLAPFAALIALREGTAAVGGIPTIDWGTPLLSRDPLLSIIVLAVTLSLIGGAALAVAAFPRQVSRIEDAIRAKPRGMGGAGLALYLLMLGVSVGMIVLLALLTPLGLLLLPLYALASMLLLAVIVAGMMTLALVIGSWLMARRPAPRPTPPLVTTVIGGLVLGLLVAASLALPFGVLIGGALLALVSAVGAGAALFTLFGTRPLRSSYFVQG